MPPRILIADFKGEIPRRESRLLPDAYAYGATNTRLTSGSLESFRRSRLQHTFADPVQTIYRHNDEWLGFGGPAKIVRGAVAQDRIYYTAGADVPRMRVGSTAYALALLPPAAAPTLTNLTTPDPSLINDVVYAYTYVTEFDEESAPSPVSAPLEWSPGVTVRVTDFSAAPGGRGINRIRLYRSQTSALGITDLYFVAEFASSTTTHDHDLATAPIQEVIPSNEYDPAPDGLRGLTAMHNGMLAAFSGRELFFCEPYRHHAWPVQYRLIVDYEIVGLASFGSTLAILTKGTPYIAQGTAPENMVMEKLNTNMPCIAPRGIVDLGYAAAYPSNNGLALITPSNVQLVSRDLFSLQDWRAMNPSEFFAENYDNRYAFAFQTGQVDFIDSETPSSELTAIYDGGGPDSTSIEMVIYDGGNALSNGGINSLGFIDLTGEQPYFIRTDQKVNNEPSGLYHCKESGMLAMICNSVDVRSFDSPLEPVAEYEWISKDFHFSGYENFGALLVETENLPVTSDNFSVEVYADDKLIYTGHVANVATRLPSGFLARKWRIEIRSKISVLLVAVSGDISDLA